MTPVGAEQSYRLAARRRQSVRDMGGSIYPIGMQHRRVIVILSAPRGYSSLLFALLRSTGRFLALRGEHTHVYKLSGLSGPLHSLSDDTHLNITQSSLRSFRDEFEWELAEQLSGSSRSEGVDIAALHIAHRLYAQWAELPEPSELLPNPCLCDSGLRLRRFYGQRSSLPRDRQEA